MGTRIISRARSGGMLAVLALCYVLALQAMLSPAAALASFGQAAASTSGHPLCGTPGSPKAPDGDGQNPCCLPGCAAACSPRQAAKDPPPAALPPEAADGRSALRAPVTLPRRHPSGTGEPSFAARPPQAHPRAPPAA